MGAFHRPSFPAGLGYLCGHFFSLCSGKRTLDILSVYPSASLFLEFQFNRLRNLPPKWLHSTVYSLIALLIILGFVCLIAGAFDEVPVSWAVFAPNGILLAAGGLLLFSRYKRFGLNNRWFYLFASYLAVNELLVGSVVFPAFNPVKSPYALAEAAMEKLPESAPLYLYRMNGEICALYANRTGKNINSIDELKTFVSESGKGLIVVSEKNSGEVVGAINLPVSVHPFTMGGKNLAWVEYGFH